MNVSGIGDHQVVWHDKVALEEIEGRSPTEAGGTMFAIRIELDNGARMAAGYCEACRSWVLLSRYSGPHILDVACSRYPGLSGCSQKVVLILPGPAERRLTRKKRFAILKRDGYRCQLCGTSATSGAQLEVDHKTPLAAGGDHRDGNLWTLCRACNQGKGADRL